MTLQDFLDVGPVSELVEFLPDEEVSTTLAQECAADIMLQIGIDRALGAAAIADPEAVMLICHGK